MKKVTTKRLGNLASTLGYTTWWHLRADLERGVQPLVTDAQAVLLTQCGYDDSGVGPSFRRQSALAAEVDAAIDAMCQ